MRTLFVIAVVGLILIALPGVMIFTADLLGYEAPVNAWLEQHLTVSHRMVLALPAALILFAVPLLLILLYFLRLKRKPVAVSSTFLWQKSIEDLHVNRLLQWLRRNVLLLLQLLGVLLLIYAALGPRLHGSLSSGQHYLILIDRSASMAATDVAPSRLEWAKAEAIREIEAATDDDFGMVIVFDRTAEIVQSRTNNRAELIAAVRAITPTQKATRIDEALSLAASLANPQRSTENAAAAPADFEPGKERTYVPNEGIPADVHLYSDGRFPTPDFALANLNLTYHVPPAPPVSDNVDILKCDVERGWQSAGNPTDEDDPADPTPTPQDQDADDQTKVTVVVSVRNFSSTARPGQKIRLELFDQAGDLQGAYRRSINLAANADQSPEGKLVVFYLSDIPEGTDFILKTSLLNNTDTFPLDDTAWAVLGVVRKAKLLILSPDNNFLLRAVFDRPAQKKICTTTYLPISAMNDPALYADPARQGQYDLVIFDRCTPKTADDLPKGNTLFIGSVPPQLADTPRRTVRGPTVQGSLDRHPLMQNLRGLYEIGIDESFALADWPNGTLKLMEAANSQLLLAGVPRGGYFDFVLAFPILTAEGSWNTRWPLEPSYVLFWRNLLLSFGSVRDAGYEESTRPGQEKILRPGSVSAVTVTKPDRTERSFERSPRPDFAYTDTTDIGIYDARWTDAGQLTHQRFAVNLFADAGHIESDLAPTTTVTIGDQAITAGEPRKQPRDLWKYAVLAGLIVLLAEWWIYNRRVHL